MKNQIIRILFFPLLPILVCSSCNNGQGKLDIPSHKEPTLFSLLPSEKTGVKFINKVENEKNFNIFKYRNFYNGGGVAIGDINNDGLSDIYMTANMGKNKLFLNKGDLTFEDISSSAGIEGKKPWSTGVNMVDINQDGLLDIYVSNAGNMEGNNHDNDLYINNGNLTFTEKAHEYNLAKTGFTTHASFFDYDKDGDLDLVASNVNSTAMLYVNETNDKANYLKIRLKFSGNNPYGIGTKIFSYHGGQLQYKELYTVRGFQSSSEPIVHFGYGPKNTIDSLKIIWPDKTYQTLKGIKTNQTLTISPDNPKSFDYRSLNPRKKLIFKKTDNNLGIDFKHKEDRYIDFNRQKLIPYQISDRGPATAIADLDNDGQDDIFFGGSKHIPSKIYIQKDSNFIKGIVPSLIKDSIKENVTAAIADFDTDGRNDIVLGNGGADFYGTMEPLLDSYFIQNDSLFSPGSLPENFHNTSVIRPNDFDSDGDLDLFIGSQAVSNDFGKSPMSYLFENIKGKFVIKENKEIENQGMVTDAVWDDFDGDGTKDLIVVGEWMSPTFFRNNKGTLTKIEAIKEQNGLWQSIIPFDIDYDGDIDYLLGNWGTNSKFKASEKEPLKMFYGDFDKNGQTETITAIAKNNKYYPLEGLNDLAGQMVSLRKKFNSFKEFSGRTIEEVLDTYKGSRFEIKEVHNLSSGFLKNESGKFTFVPFGNELQVSPIMAFLKFDFDFDGKDEVLAGGNYFGVKPFHGRFDSFSGALINDENNIFLGHEIGLQMTNKSVRHLNILNMKDGKYVLITYNNANAEVYKIEK